MIGLADAGVFPQISTDGFHRAADHRQNPFQPGREAQPMRYPQQTESAAHSGLLNATVTKCPATMHVQPAAPDSGWYIILTVILLAAPNLASTGRVCQLSALTID